MLKDTITVTTLANGTATAYSRILNGAIRSIIYTKGDYAADVDFTITTDVTGRTVWTEADVNASQFVNPRDIIHSGAGAAQAIGTAGWADVHLVKERLKIVIASGGDTKVGTFVVIVSNDPAPGGIAG